MDDMTLLALMKAKRRQPAGPEPMPADFDDQDVWRAKWFGWRLRSLGITVDGLSAASGVARTTVLALAGSGGKSPQTRWSTVSRDALLKLWRTLQVVCPHRVDELRELLHIARDHAPAVWVEPEALIGEAVGLVLISTPVRIRWDVRLLTSPQVSRGPDGMLYVSEDVPDGHARLGALREILPA